MRTNCTVDQKNTQARTVDRGALVNIVRRGGSKCDDAQERGKNAHMSADSKRCVLKGEGLALSPHAHAVQTCVRCMFNAVAAKCCGVEVG